MNIVDYIDSVGITKLEFARACGLNHANDHSMVAKVDTWIRSGYLVVDSQLVKVVKDISLEKL